jgi:flagellar M-ring protein FliF
MRNARGVTHTQVRLRAADFVCVGRRASYQQPSTSIGGNRDDRTDRRNLERDRYRFERAGATGDTGDAGLMPVIDIARLKERGRRLADGFTPGQRAVTILAVATIVVAAVAYTRWAAQPDARPSTAAPNVPVAGAASGTDPQLAQAQTYDAALEQRIDDMVSRTLGPGHVAVTVAAQLDNSNHKSVTTKYNEVRPGSTVPITQNDLEETLGPNPPATGTPTTPTTVYEKTQTQHRNAIDSTVTNSDTPPGTLKRLSVSVLLDRAVVTPAEVSSLWRPSIQAAAGIVPARDGNDALKVMTVAFDKNAQKTQAQLAAPARSHPLIDLGEYVLTLLMLALVLIFAWRAIRRAEGNRAPIRTPLDLRELDMTRSAGAPLESAAGARAGAAPFPASLDASASSIEAAITDLIERQPDEVAQTLRSWLADRRT